MKNNRAEEITANFTSPPESLLLHVCCGPCAAAPMELIEKHFSQLNYLKPEAHSKVRLWFYNPNIHPKSEYLRRRDSLAFLALHYGWEIEFAPYEPGLFMEAIKADTSAPQRCRQCYALRLIRAAETAARLGYPAFSTTLSFSRRQNHELILEEGHQAAQAAGVHFHYQDWRPLNQRGHEISRSLGIYRQNYCGCLYSEFER